MRNRLHRPDAPARRRLAFALLIALVTLAGGAAADEGYKTLSADEVEKMLGAPDVRIFDANDRQLFQKNHVPGAVLIGDRQLASILPADRSVRLVFYCTNPH